MMFSVHHCFALLKIEFLFCVHLLFFVEDGFLIGQHLTSSFLSKLSFSSHSHREILKKIFVQLLRMAFCYFLKVICQSRV